MKKILIAFVVLLTVNKLPAQLKPVDEESSVAFKIKNLGFGVPGTLKGLQGTIRFDMAAPANAMFDITLNAATINTDNNLRDEHLRGETYFNVKQFPTIRFVSISVTQGKQKNTWNLNGKLTIKSFTKDVTIPFVFAAATGGGYLFTGNFSINRKDFHIGGASPISDNLDCNLRVVAR